MTKTTFRDWQSVHDEVRRRINLRQWKPGDIIPNEVSLAGEFGCARTTVNRALRNLAEEGLLDRRRKAGTRVALHPIRKATLNIPIIKNEIEGKGSTYRYSLVSAQTALPPQGIKARMKCQPDDRLLHLICVHMADGKPYVFENRWINPKIIPEINGVSFRDQSPNKWLVENISFNSGDITFSALSATKFEADILACQEGEGLFVIDRSTWRGDEAITSVRLTFAPGYRMHTDI